VFAAAAVGLEGFKKIVHQTIRKASGQNMMAFLEIKGGKTMAPRTEERY
jgi:hypothetical protein